MNSRFEIKYLSPSAYPPLLIEATDPPARLSIIGSLPDPNKFVYLTVVGSRRYSTYGRETCRSLISNLTGYPIAIVSGLALGIDAIAHEAALAAGLPTIAVPGSGLNPDVLYPAANHGLAEKIIRAGGCLLSEFAPDFQATTYSFPQRNRIMAALSQATLIIEATERSGTLITARLALDYNRDVLIVPGPIFNEGSAGPLSLLKDGAQPISSSLDLLEALGVQERISDSDNIHDLSLSEKIIYKLLSQEPLNREDILMISKLSIEETNMALSQLELRNLIEEAGGEFYLKNNRY